MFNGCLYLVISVLYATILVPGYVTADQSSCESSPCENGGTCTPGNGVGVFECECKTGFAGVTCSIGKPTAPVSVTATAVAGNIRTILIEWSQYSTKKSSQPEEYTLEYKMNTKSYKRVKASIFGNERSHEVTSLQPGATYKFRLIAINIAGDSRASEPSNDVIIPEMAPSSPPREVSAKAKSATKIRVRWRKPHRDDLNGVLLGFRVIYQVDNEDKYITVSDPEQSYVDLLNLAQDTSYTVYVVAFNAAGQSSYSEAVEARTFMQGATIQSRIGEDGTPSPGAVNPPSGSGCPCVNGGKCILLNDRYSCICGHRYTGVHCEKKISDFCFPCVDGTCKLASDGKYYCVCHQGFYGENCEHRIVTACTNNPCNNGGMCKTHIININKYTCECPPQFTGLHCDERVKGPCEETNYCQNGGACIEVSLKIYRCHCLPGFIGHNCQQVDDNQNSFSFSSENSESELQLCVLDCGNNGICRGGPFNREQFCDCYDGYTGEFCTIPSVSEGPCHSHPCLNGATCSSVPVPGVDNLVNNYVCICEIGFVGTNCQIIIEQELCTPQRCKNGGTCREYIGDEEDSYSDSSAFEHYICTCRVGYTGTHCENRIPLESSTSSASVIGPCDLNPCQHEGRCLELQPAEEKSVASSFSFSFSYTEEYSCLCKPGYSGKNCEISDHPEEVDHCERNPCRNGGRCINEPMRYRCECLPGFEGANCDTVPPVLDPCVINPCQNGGICTKEGATYRCQCPPGVEGDTCSLISVPDPCVINPCQNGGICTKEGATYRCQCPPGVEGDTCSLISGRSESSDVVGPCDENPCQNGGTCRALRVPQWESFSSASSVESYTCICDEGYAGYHCEIRTLPATCPTPAIINGVAIGLNTEGEMIEVHCNEGYTLVGRQFLTCIDGSYGDIPTCEEVDYESSAPTPLPDFTTTPLPDPCDPNPCYNGGNCIPGDLLPPVATSFTGEMQLLYLCQCDPPYSGFHCEVLKPEPSYSSEDVANPCSVNPCENGGRCIVKDSLTDLSSNGLPNFLEFEYVCDCPSDFKGYHCQIPEGTSSSSDYNPQFCEVNVCQNGGDCIVNSLEDAFDYSEDNLGYKCICPVGYFGMHCEYPEGSCPLPTIQNGYVSGDPTPGGVTTFGCLNGYRLLGQNSLVCLDGKYDNEIPTCELIVYCYPILENGPPISPVEDGDVVEFSCLAGYVLVGPHSALCVDGTVTETPQCKAIVYCYPILENGPPISPVEDGDVVEFSCLAGYVLVGPHSSLCVDGTVTETPQCKEICELNRCQNGGECFYEYHEESSDFGEDYYKCICHGGYIGKRCEYPEGSCPLLTVAHGHVVGDPTPGSLVTFECMEYYTLVGPDSVVCLNGKYDNEIPACKEYCISQLENGPEVIAVHGEMVEFSCHAGYVVVGPHSSLCVDGRLTVTETPAQCKEKCVVNECQNGGECFNDYLEESSDNVEDFYNCACPVGYIGKRCEYPEGSCPLLKIANGRVFGDPTPGSLITIECMLDYTLVGPDSVVCLNGKYDNEIPTCKADCFSQLENGPDIFTGHGQMVEFSCHAGYILVGPQSTLCLDGRLTVTETPRCEVESSSSSPIDYSSPDYDSSSVVVSSSSSTIILHTCRAKPCLNNGTCSDTPTFYTCLCPKEYTGVNCERNNPCASDPCLNGANCRITDAPGTEGFECLCLDGFTGEFCSNENCVLPLGIPHGDVAGSTKHNEYITYTCSEGFTLVGNRQRKCVGGVYGGSTPSCHLNCDPFYIENGMVVGDFRHGTNVYVVCEENFVYEGSSFISCMDGSYNFDDMPVCKDVNPCVSSPCLNGATCRVAKDPETDSSKGFECLCKQGYTGEYCGEVVDPCKSQPCLNGGECMVDFLTYTCSCTEEYLGDKCEIRNPCSPSPCNHFGRCTTRPGEESSLEAVCHCTDSYTGDYCDEVVDPCKSQPCMNAGECVMLDFSTYSCKCADEYLGDNCELENPCSPSPCKNGAACDTFPGQLSRLEAVCECTKGYKGEYCDEVIDPCKSQPCLNGGGCNMIDFSTYTCSCTEEYLGSDCEIRDPCKPTPCKNGAACTTGPGQLPHWEAVCECTEEYEGEYCDEVVDPCKSQPCLNGGECNMVDFSTYSCSCTEEYLGKNCEISNPCSSSPCKNGAVCTAVSGQTLEFVCECTEDYEGEYCDEVVDPCKSQPCLNGGECNMIDFSTYTCSCTEKYLGKDCEISNPCSSSPCKNGAACTTVSGQTLEFVCECTEDYEGEYCDKVVDPCKSQPCLNGGECNMIDFSTYTCSCTEEYLGSDCEIRNPCSSSPCTNGAVCTAVSGQTLEFVCECTEDYEGEYCDEVVDPCKSQPCLNGGECNMIDFSTYACSCTEEYLGSDCELRNPCSSSPCKNGAGCTTVSGQTLEFVCECTEDYEGEYCDEVVDPCKSQPCLNGGECNMIDFSTYTCSCTEEYLGKNCEIRNPCLSSPCKNGAGCTAVSGQTLEFVCECTEDYEGEYCDEVVDPCKSQPCLNGGECNMIDSTTYTCICTKEYNLRDDCGIRNPCIPTPCKKGATCSTRPGELTPLEAVCICAEGFKGEYCDEVVHPCESQPCLNGGVCAMIDSTTYTCGCPEEYNLRDDCGIRNPCIPTPCKNGATCSTRPGELTPLEAVCICAEGFEGEYCDEVVDPCKSQPCLNGGECNMIDFSTYACSCTEEYLGSDCELRNPCSSSPCKNGAVCTTVSGQTLEFVCECTEDYEGEYCDEVVDPCKSQPCLNGGECNMIDFSTYTCSCTEEFLGKNCELRNPCLSSPCLNGGECNMIDFSTYTCSCTEEYLGEDCELRNPCSPSPCKNGAACTTVSGQTFYEAVCECTQEFEGEYCDEVVDPCKSQPCLNGGECNMIDFSTYTCSCTEEYLGEDCELRNPCSPSPCKNGASCTTVSGQTFYEAVCECTQEFEGEYCDEVVDPCKSQPCLNGGECNMIDFSTYTCSCTEEYLGEDCEIRNPCSPSPCDNGAACTIRSEKSFYEAVCECTKEYEGEYCDEVVDPCKSQPCLNGGECNMIDFSTYTCSCTEEYLGSDCEIRNPCSPSPCKNGAACTILRKQQSLYEAVCECTEDYEGEYCDEAVDPCKSQPCLNGGECNIIDFSTYTCSCTEEYLGSNCEIRNPCSPSPCKNGAACTTRPGEQSRYEAVCECTEDYEGEYCDEVVDPCKSQPCLNGGDCDMIDSTTYNCICTEEYLGDSCELVNPCMPSPCVNALFCDILNASPPGQQTPFEFECTCIEGYTGKLCDQVVDPCESNPCQNNGQCDMIDSSTYMCHCTEEYKGDNCELRNPCVPSPCENEATCTTMHSGPGSSSLEVVCHCTDGYTGEYCDEVVDPCKSQPCLNGGECNMIDFSTYTCSCTEEYLGSDCEIRNPCLPTPCKNGAACNTRPGEQSFLEPVCACTEEYTGEYCEIVVDPCKSQPCLNGGECNMIDFSTYTCSCTEEYLGSDCEIRNPCSPSPCKNGAACTTGPGQQSILEAICECTEEYTGTFCEDVVDPCSSQPCQNNGQCDMIDLSTYMCHCTEGYLGDKCEMLDPCSPSPCQNQGSCTTRPGQSPPEAVCFCTDEYTGDYCDEVVDPCKSQPCLNGGECNMIDFSSYACSCTEAYFGSFCQVFEPCSSSPCNNGGTCNSFSVEQQDALEFVCECTKDYEGENCDDVVDPCKSQLCLNAGECVMIDSTTYTCKCSEGYLGDNCGIRNPCSSYPCQNGAVCTTGPGQQSPIEFVCECTEDYEGEFCDKELDPCSPQPCQNNGLCNKIDSLTYECDCTEGYLGDNCEIDNPCLPSPCENGAACNVVAGQASGFVCDCTQEYTGDYCEKAVDPCSSQPCLNNGICDKIDSIIYECRCTNEYLGDNCEIMDPCSQTTCKNGGICTSSILEPPGQDPTAVFECECLVGYTGNYCEDVIVVDPCSSGPCQNGGECQLSQLNSYVCSCANDYYGHHCQLQSPCLSNPCFNGGTCNSVTDGQSVSYQCTCIEGFIGDRCQEFSDVDTSSSSYFDPCASEPCQNDGFCTFGDDFVSYVCYCQGNYDGVNCENPISMEN